jgi:hypothetical protein
MRPVISLAAYGLKVRNIGDRNFEILSDLDAEGSDLLDFLQTVMTEIKNSTLDQKELQQAMAVSRLDRQSRILTGTIDTGDYGRESNFINVGTKKIVYRRKKEDAEMQPVYFYIEIPEGSEDGLLILQRTGHHGIMRVVQWVLDTALTLKHPDLKLRLSPLIDEDEMEKYVKGHVQEIRFVRKTIAPDIEDNYDRGHQEVRGSMELVLRANRGSALPLNGWLSKKFSSRKPVGVFAIDDSQQFEYDNVKARVKIGQSSRTINAANQARLRPYYDVTEDVTIGGNGHATHDSVDIQARELAAKFRAMLYG